MRTITRVAPLAFLVLVGGCQGFDATPSEVFLTVGETERVHIVGRYYNFPFGVVTTPARVFSSDRSIATVESSFDSPYATIHARTPGTAYLITEVGELRVVTVNVFPCPQILITPDSAHVAAKAGVPVRLQVTATGFRALSLVWFEERPSGWSQIPFASGPVYEFTPRTSGIYRFQARYEDLCGHATSTFTVAAATRTRAVAH